MTFSFTGWKTIKMEAAIRPEVYGMACCAAKSWTVTVIKGVA